MNSEQSDRSIQPLTKTFDLKLHLRRNKKIKVRLIISKIKLEFSSSITIKSSKIVSLPLCFLINCIANDKEAENNNFILTFFYLPNLSRRYFDIGKLQFSLFDDSDESNEYKSSADVCQIINQYLKVSEIESEKPYLLLLNPRSGVRRGQKIFSGCVSEVFKRCNIKYELSITEKPLHARTLIKGFDSLNKYRGIVTISGDGLLYEVLCGIMDRDSWKEDIDSVPIGVIPAGSGNGLAATIAAFSGLNPRGNIILHSSLLLTKPTVRPLDLMKVQTSAGIQFPSFLSLTWGLMAHVDVGSDKFRWMGHGRFYFVAAIQIAKMTKYKGKLWYLPINSDNCNNGTSEVQQDEISHSSNETTENVTFANTPFKYLPDISQPIPDDNKWILLDQTFISVMVSLLPYVATDANMAPKARMDDGKIHIIVINPDISRSDLLNAITKLETGGHFLSDKIKYIECLAFRLVPECDQCYMAVDGEYQENIPIQAEIMASVAKTFTGACADGDISLR